MPATIRTLGEVNPLAHFGAGLLQVIGWGTFFTFLFLFPNGHFVPRWTRLVPFVLVAIGLGWLFVPGANAFDWPLPLALLALFLASSTGLFAQLYRYWWVSSRVEQQQTKWVVFGAGCAAVGTLLFALVGLISPDVSQPSAARVLYLMLGIPFFALSLFQIPATIAISILRYRLWDIDLLIRRTLIYSVLTLQLLLVYFASIVVFGAAVRALTGQGQSELVTVVSTLLIAALFAPVRSRVQGFIDRRFYRRKYDAALTLAVFSLHVRDETNLDNLQRELIDVVGETMQPMSVSLWLKPNIQNVKTGRSDHIS
ncbi:MAG: hypothetical protein LC737_03380 [Chloroflexi bacterium]|nr:hypothetical protein [Chloroflexota bacterium]